MLQRFVSVWHTTVDADGYWYSCGPVLKLLEVLETLQYIVLARALTLCLIHLLFLTCP